MELPTEQLELIEVKLGKAAMKQLKHLCRYMEQTPDQVISDALLIMGITKIHTHINRIEKDLRGVIVKPKAKAPIAPTTPEEKAVIAHYRKVYDIDKHVRIHLPAALSVIRSCELDHDTMISIIDLSAEDEWVRTMMSRGQYVPLHTILGQKMLAKLLPLLDSFRSFQIEQEQVQLEGSVKPQAIASLQGALDKDHLSAAYDKIQAATNAKEVSSIVAHALTEQSEAYQASLRGGESDE